MTTLLLTFLPHAGPHWPESGCPLPQLEGCLLTSHDPDPLQETTIRFCGNQTFQVEMHQTCDVQQYQFCK